MISLIPIPLQHISTASFSFTQRYLTAVVHPCLTHKLGLSFFLISSLYTYQWGPGVLSFMGHGITWESDKSVFFSTGFYYGNLEVYDHGFYGFPHIACGGIQAHTHITDIFYYILLYYYSHSHPHTWAAFFLLYLLYIEVSL
jgi:hypothetical protein